MPAKRDLWPICEELGRRAGIVTRLRGFWLPAEMNWGPEKYPAMGYWEQQETNVFPSLGARSHGAVSLGIWMHAKNSLQITSATGALYIPDAPSMLLLDDLHDTFMSLLAKSFNPDDPGGSLHSQTITLVTEEKSVLWEHQWTYAESPHVGAVLTLPYQFTCASVAP